MRRSERRNNLRICPRRDSNTGGSDLWSNTLPLDHGGALSSLLRVLRTNVRKYKHWKHTLDQRLESRAPSIVLRVYDWLQQPYIEIQCWHIHLLHVSTVISSRQYRQDDIDAKDEEHRDEDGIVVAEKFSEVCEYFVEVDWVNGGHFKPAREGFASFLWHKNTLGRSQDRILAQLENKRVFLHSDVVL